jgi:hypothetical protein
MLEMASVARCLIPTSGVTTDGQPITFAGSRAAEARSVQHITAHQGREWRSAAPHFDRRFPASFRRDLVRLRAAPQTPRRLRCRAGNRLALLVRYDVARSTIVAVPRRAVVAVPRRTYPHPARADGAPEMRKGCSAVARRYCDPLRPRNCRPDYRSVESAMKGHAMAAGKAAASGGRSRGSCEPRCFYKRLRS